MNHILNFINSHHNAIFNLTIETIRSVPAWIALVITFILPNKTKKLDIEKMHKQFIFEEKYKIYTEHFSKLYDFNNSIKTFLTILNGALEASYKGSDIAEAKQNLYLSWDNIKNYEAKLWIIAPENILQLRTKLLFLIKDLKTKINSIDSNGIIEYSTKDLNELIKIAEDIQVPLSQYLTYYRTELEKSFA